MNEVNAFVGHSFSAEDATIVSWFLKLFDQIRGLHPTFSWEHAEGAEPRELAEKVLGLLAGKNVFIGICTKKERVLGPSQAVRLLLQPAYYKVKEADLQWKTSDWIVQEIGLAVGRGLDLILLIEEGVRPPGGLQGNVEYITFSREVPERSSVKILEMIRALSPRPAQIGATVADSAPASQTKESAPDDTDEEWAVPKPDWSSEEFRRAFFFSIVRDRSDDAEKINAAFLASDHGKVETQSAEWSAHVEYVRICFGKGGSFAKLKELAEANQTSRKILFYFARAQDIYGEHKLAAVTYKAAAATATDSADRVRLLGYSAIQSAEAGDSDVASKLVDELRLTANLNEKIELDVLGTIRRVAELQKNDDAAVSAMERIVEIAPDDVEVRFSLAYKHSELGNEDLAIYHYLKIPSEERNPIAWNNLGVSFDHFGMPAKSVGAYRRAAERNETLAMSNLGQKFLRAGFLKEAQSEFDRALAIPGFHKNIGFGVARLKEVDEEEDKKENEVLEGARRKIEFYNLLGRSVSRPRSASIGTRWQGPVCELAVSTRGDKIRALGTYEQDANPLLTGLTLGARRLLKYNVEYEGTVSGTQIEGTVRRTRDGDKPAASSLLSFDDTKSKVLIAICDRGVLEVMENPHGTSPSYYKFQII